MKIQFYSLRDEAEGDVGWREVNVTDLLELPLLFQPDVIWSQPLEPAARYHCDQYVNAPNLLIRY